ncbi:RagB/SusD family nutrient uptake outer membrane protein [Ekhidna sp.]
MKNRILSITLLLTAFLYSACDDAFTETPPAEGVLSEENLKDAEGNFTREAIELFVINAYANLYGNNVGDPWLGTPDNWWFDVITDDAHKGSDVSDQPDLEQLRNYTYNASNPYFLTKWQTLIGGVVTANNVIANSEGVEGVDDLVAEARFLRGHFNFELQRSWDKVPYISEDDTTANIANTGDIWAEIEADFQFAIDNLPAAASIRANGMSARAYLGKVLLQQGKYSNALTVLNEVITSGAYSLETEFEDNFKSTTENGSESVFAIQFTAQDGASGTENGNLGSTLNHPAGGPYGSCCGFFQPTQDLANAFKTGADGLPLLDTYNDSDITNDNEILSTAAFSIYTDPLDPRIDYTVGRRGVDFNGWGLNPGADWIRDAGGAWSSGPYLSKKNTYKESDFSDAQGSGPWGQQSSGLNYNVIRYADVLLMAAEAAAETNDLATALNYVNQVRQRAKDMTPVSDAINYNVEPYTAFADQAFAIAAVRHERRLELAMEGHRFFDLKRYGATDATQILSDFETNEQRTISAYDPGAFAERFLTFPIPSGAIDISGGVLTQNDAWN